MNEALTRILGPKAHMGLHKKAKEELAPESGVLEQVLGRKEYKEMSKIH